MDRQTVLELLAALPDAREDSGTFTFEKGRSIALHIGHGESPYTVRDVERVEVRERLALVTAEDGKVFVVPLGEVRWVSAQAATQKSRPGFGR